MTIIEEDEKILYKSKSQERFCNHVKKITLNSENELDNPKIYEQDGKFVRKQAKKKNTQVNLSLSKFKISLIGIKKDPSKFSIGSNNSSANDDKNASNKIFADIYCKIDEYLQSNFDDENDQSQNKSKKNANKGKNIVKNMTKIFNYVNFILYSKANPDNKLMLKNEQLQKEIKNYQQQIKKLEDQIKSLELTVKRLSEDSEKLKLINENIMDFEKTIYENKPQLQMKKLIFNARREVKDFRKNYKIKEMEYLNRLTEQNEQLHEYEKQITDLTMEKISRSTNSFLFPTLNPNKHTRNLVKYCPKKDREEAKERQYVHIPTKQNTKIKFFSIKVDTLEDNSQEYLYTAIKKGKFNRTLKYKDSSIFKNSNSKVKQNTANTSISRNNNQ